MLESSLTKWGYEVVVTGNGADALVDVMMPGMEGAEVCRRVRQMALDNQTYIILLTAKSSNVEFVKGLLGRDVMKQAPPP
jgi:DNA-binding response OmpR family regulator